MDACIFIIAHAPLGQALNSALHDILPSYLIDSIVVFDVEINANPEKKVREGLALIQKTKAKKIIILTDLIGATPYNIARNIMRNLDNDECALITGISLPMLIKAINYQKLYLEKWVAEITESVLQWTVIEFKINPQNSIS